MANLNVPCKHFECEYEEIKWKDDPNPHPLGFQSTTPPLSTHRAAKRPLARKEWRPIFGKARCAWKLAEWGQVHMGVRECENCDHYCPRH